MVTSGPRSARLRGHCGPRICGGYNDAPLETPRSLLQKPRADRRPTLKVCHDRLTKTGVLLLSLVCD
jgi:hypothetical protein